MPPTVIREDAPLGVGSLQWFIECDFREHYFTLFEDAPETHRDLARIALFDYVANNTDRKSGHVLRGDDGRVWGIDHGLCFSAGFKLRTVIWDFAGEPIPDALLEDIPRSPRPLLPRWPNSSTTTRSPPCSAASSACCTQGCCRLTAPACATPGRSCKGPDSRVPAGRAAPRTVDRLRGPKLAGCNLPFGWPWPAPAS